MGIIIVLNFKVAYIWELAVIVKKSMKMRKLVYIFTIVFTTLLIISCKKKHELNPYYLALDEDKNQFALFQIKIKKDSVFGNVFWINRKDTTQIKGYLKDSVLIFRTYRNDIDENFEYEGIIKTGSEIFLKRREVDSIFKPDNFILKTISFEKYSLIQKKVLAPPKLLELKKDTIIGEYLFELKVKNWNPETMLGNTTFTIKNKKSNETLQTIISNEFNFNKHLSYGFSDINFDGINDLTFFTGFRGSYGTQTYDYYIYNTEKNKFVFNKQLTDIASGMGIEFDTVKKRILSFEKSGCCWHKEEAFVFKGDSLMLIKRMTIDEKEDVTIENKIKGKWHKTYKKVEDFKTNKDSDIWKNF